MNTSIPYHLPTVQALQPWRLLREKYCGDLTSSTRPRKALPPSQKATQALSASKTESDQSDRFRLFGVTLPSSQQLSTLGHPVAIDVRSTFLHRQGKSLFISVTCIKCQNTLVRTVWGRIHSANLSHPTLSGVGHAGKAQARRPTTLIETARSIEQARLKMLFAVGADHHAQARMILALLLQI